MERKKEVTLFCLGFSVCVGGQRRSGACLFLLGFSWRRWRQQLHNLDPRIPPPTLTPHYVAGGARPPDRFQDSAMVETRCDPVACTVFPGLLPPLTPGPPPTPPLQPHPQPPPQSSQRESCQLGDGLEQSAGGHPRQDGYDLGHGNCDLCVLIPVALASSSSCMWAV